MEQLQAEQYYKMKPQVEILKDLMKHTFPNQFRQAIQGFCSVIDHESLRHDFDDEFPKWMKAVICYCKDTQVRSTAIQSESSGFRMDIDEGIDMFFKLLSCHR